MVRYVSIGERVEAHELTLPLTVNLVSADEAAAAGPDAEVTDEVVVLMAARAQREARARADAGDFDAAKTLIRSASQELRKRAPGSAQAAELLAQAEAMEEDVGFLSPATYDAGTKKRMLYKSTRVPAAPRPSPRATVCPRTNVIPSGRVTPVV